MSALEEKRAEIEKLIERYDWHQTQIREIAPRLTEKMSSFTAYCIEHGRADDLPIALGLLAKLRAVTSKDQPLAAITGNSNVA
jgi:hypothetical protein